MTLQLRPSTIGEARDFIERHHSHLPRVVGGLWAVACEDDGRLCGVALMGRPVSRILAQDPRTLELSRVCTDRTKNVASMLTAAAWRAARAMGCDRLVTYTLEHEKGTPYKAAGFRDTGHLTRRQRWAGRPGRGRDEQGALAMFRKRRWEARARWDDG